MNSKSSAVIELLSIYKRAAKDATKGLRLNWIIILGSLVVYFAYSIDAYIFFAQFQMGGRMLLSLLQIILLSFFYSWLAETVDKEKLSFSSLFQMDYKIFFGLIGAAFIIFLAEYVISILSQGLNQRLLIQCFRVFVFVLLNAVPEMVFIHKYDGFPAVAEGLKFVRDRWIEWFIPFMLILTPILLVYPDFILVYFASGISDPVFPARIVTIVPEFLLQGGSYLSICLGILLLNWFSLFRAYLFKELERGGGRGY